MVGLTQNVVWVDRRKITRLSKIREKFAVIIPPEWVHALYSSGSKDPVYVDIAILNDGRLIITPAKDLENKTK